MVKYHHGYLLVGDTEKALETALQMAAEILEIKKDTLQAHPDFSFLKTDLLSINDARQIRERSSKKSFSGKGRIFIIQSNFFSREACNALLKTFEDPTGLSYFFLITSSIENILETLRSRLFVLECKRTVELSKEKREFTEKFLNAGSDKRMKAVKNLSKDKEKVLDFLNGLEIILRKALIKNPSKEIIKSLDELIKHRILLYQRSSSLKMITDYICLTLPKL